MRGIQKEGPRVRPFEVGDNRQGLLVTGSFSAGFAFAGAFGTFLKFDVTDLGFVVGSDFGLCAASADVFFAGNDHDFSGWDAFEFEGSVICGFGMGEGFGAFAIGGARGAGIAAARAALTISATRGDGGRIDGSDASAFDWLAVAIDDAPGDGSDGLGGGIVGAGGGRGRKAEGEGESQDGE
jgi:hypothetical protein